jgi:hypothetical protein
MTFSVDIALSYIPRQNIGKSQAKHRPSKKQTEINISLLKPLEYKHLINLEIILYFSLIIPMPNNSNMLYL